MTTFDTLAERYIDLWNETDPAARRRGVDELWSDNARYVDPMVDAQGREAIDQTIAAVQEQFPGFAFRLAGRSTPTTTRVASPGSWDRLATRLRSSVPRRGRPRLVIRVDATVTVMRRGLLEVSAPKASCRQLRPGRPPFVRARREQKVIIDAPRAEADDRLDEIRSRRGLVVSMARSGE